MVVTLFVVKIKRLLYKVQSQHENLMVQKTIYATLQLKRGIIPFKVNKKGYCENDLNVNVMTFKAALFE